MGSIWAFLVQLESPRGGGFHIESFTLFRHMGWKILNFEKFGLFKFTKTLSGHDTQYMDIFGTIGKSLRMRCTYGSFHTIKTD